MRILIAGFQHETNTFAPSKAAYENFIRGEGFPALCRGNDIFKLRDVNIPIGGFIQHMEHHELIPVIWAAASPSAHVTQDAYERIAGEIIDAITQTPLDAIYLDLHGAMVTENIDDGEGELLARIRKIVGPSVPIIASLDLHANVTSQMLEQADALIAFRTYPHVDMAETGTRAAAYMETLVSNNKPVYRKNIRLPFLIPVNAMCTMLEPANGTYDAMRALEISHDVVLSFTPGFPAADFAECGPVLWGYGHDQAKLEDALNHLNTRLLKGEADWQISFYPPMEAVREAQRISAYAKRPVVIADTQDNPGAGGNSNTTGLLRALIDCKAQMAAIGLIYDPAAAALAHSTGVGNMVTMAIGGEANVPGDKAFEGTFLVEHVSNGSCILTGPMMTGMRMELGPVACLKIDDVRIVVSSMKAPMQDRTLYRIAGIEPEKMKILVNKSSVHFRADFQPIAEDILISVSPGPFIANPDQLPWTKLTKGIRLTPNGRPF